MERGFGRAVVGQQEEETDTRRRRNNIHCRRRRPRVSERSPAKQRPSASVHALCRWFVPPRRHSSGRSLVRRSRHSISIFWW